MADEARGGTIGSLAGPDLGAVGNAARVSKTATRAPQELQSFSVRKGDNGGVLVCETYERKAPEGRRASTFMGGGDYKENPFSPDDGAAATRHITGLLSQMGVQAAPPASAPMAPPRPVAAVARGPNVAAAAVRRPGGGGSTGAMFRGPDVGY